jgi:hypothetical protein
VSQSFKITADFRAFMRAVAAELDFGEVGTTVEHECGRGTRVAPHVYRFTYLEKDGHGRWEVELREEQIRDIAGGLLEEIDAVPLAEGTRTSRGEALLVWGEYDDDALRVRTLGDLAIALDAMQTASLGASCLLRLWSTGDEQAVAALDGFECAIYVVHSGAGYARSVGDPTREDTFEVNDHELGPVSFPGADTIPWRIARPALLKFAESGELGDGIILDGSIPTQLLMLGDYDREAELAKRRPPPADPALSSLPRKAPHGEWAARLVQGLLELQLIEIDMQIVDAVTARIAILLIARGDQALESPEAAQQLAKEVERVRGVGALFATGGDLQIAMRRTQDPATQPVEVPFT